MGNIVMKSKLKDNILKQVEDIYALREKDIQINFAEMLDILEECNLDSDWNQILLRLHDLFSIKDYVGYADFLQDEVLSKISN